MAFLVLNLNIQTSKSNEKFQYGSDYSSIYPDFQYPSSRIVQRSSTITTRQYKHYNFIGYRSSTRHPSKEVFHKKYTHLPHEGRPLLHGHMGKIAECKYSLIIQYISNQFQVKLKLSSN